MRTNRPLREELLNGRARRRLPTEVVFTYIKYRPGKDRNSVVSTRFKLSETDAQIKAK